MKKYILSMFAVTLAILLVGIISDSGLAENSKRVWTENDSRSDNVVTISGVVTGSLRGEIRLGGGEVVLTEETRFYKTGKGMIRQGSFVKDTPIYVIGVNRDGRTYAKLVIISDRKNIRKGVAVRVLDPNEPL